MDSNEIIADETIDAAEALRQELAALDERFPLQGFQGALLHGIAAIKQVQTFRSVYELALQGKFEDIRPDILVPHFEQLIAIHRYRLACDGDTARADNT